MELRQLVSTDAPQYRALRLRALREHPDAFGSSVEEEELLELADFAARLCDSSGNNIIYGAFDGNALVGMVGLSRMARRKTQHKAMLGHMYVAPAARGRGVGRALIDAVLRHARAMHGLEDITLAVTVGNEVARALYIDAGFVPYGVEPRYIKLGDRAYDIEWMMLHL